MLPGGPLIYAIGRVGFKAEGPAMLRAGNRVMLPGGQLGYATGRATPYATGRVACLRARQVLAPPSPDPDLFGGYRSTNRPDRAAE